MEVKDSNLSNVNLENEDNNFNTKSSNVLLKTHKQLIIPLDNDYLNDYEKQNVSIKENFQKNPKLKDLFALLSNPLFESKDNKNVKNEYFPNDQDDNLTNRLKKYLQGNKSRLSKTSLSEKVGEFKLDLESLKERINQINNNKFETSVENKTNSTGNFLFKITSNSESKKEEYLTLQNYFEKYVSKKSHKKTSEIKVIEYSLANRKEKNKNLTKLSLKQQSSLNILNAKKEEKHNFLTVIQRSILANKKKFEENNLKFLNQK